MDKRKSLRLAEHDYSHSGAYFVTVCTHDRKQIFWDTTICVGANCVRPQTGNILSEYGNIVDREINKISNIYDDAIVIDKYVIMPNHIHMIIMVNNNGRTQ